MVSQQIACQKEEKSESWWCCSSQCQPLTWWHCKPLTEEEAERASCPSSHSMPTGSNLSSLTLLNPFNKHFLKQNALRGITRIKAFLLTPSMHKRAGFGHTRYQSCLGTSDLGNPVTVTAKRAKTGVWGRRGAKAWDLESLHSA